MSLTSFHVHLHSLWPVRHSHSKVSPLRPGAFEHLWPHIQSNNHPTCMYSVNMYTQRFFNASAYIHVYSVRPPNSRIHVLWCMIIWPILVCAVGLTVSICVDAALWGMAVFSHNYGKLAGSALCFHWLRTELLWFESNVVFLLHQYTYSAICCSSAARASKELCLRRTHTAVQHTPCAIHPTLCAVTYSLVFSQVPKLVDALASPYYCVYCILESLAPNRTLLKQEYAYWIETLFIISAYFTYVKLVTSGTEEIPLLIRSLLSNNLPIYSF